MIHVVRDDPTLPKHLGRVVVFFGPKAGAGQTTLLVNTAVLASMRFRRKVCIVDLDLQHGDVAIHLNLYPSKTLSQLIEEPEPWRGEAVANHVMHHEESGVDVLLAPARPEYVEIVQPVHVAMAVAKLRESHDLVLVDAYGANTHAMSALDLAHLILLTCTTELSRIKNVKLILDLLGSLNYKSELIALILNQRDRDPGALTQNDVEAGLKLKVALSIPQEPRLVDCINRGRPLSLERSPSLVSQVFRNAHSASEGVREERDGPFLEAMTALTRLVLGEISDDDEAKPNQMRA